LLVDLEGETVGERKSKSSADNLFTWRTIWYLTKTRLPRRFGGDVAKKHHCTTPTLHTTFEVFQADNIELYLKMDSKMSSSMSSSMAHYATGHNMVDAAAVAAAATVVDIAGVALKPAEVDYRSLRFTPFTDSDGDNHDEDFMFEKPLDKTAFNTKTFDACSYVGDQLSRARSTSASSHLLEHLHKQLMAYAAELQSQLIDLLNRDYADFVGLSSNLQG
jgi:COG2 N-terminal